MTKFCRDCIHFAQSPSQRRRGEAVCCADSEHGMVEPINADDTPDLTECTGYRRMAKA